MYNMLVICAYELESDMRSATVEISEKKKIVNRHDKCISTKSALSTLEIKFFF